MRTNLAIILALATAGAAGSASAQQGSCPLPPGAASAPEIAVGNIRRGTLQRDAERQPFRLSLSGTAAAQVDLESDAFDPRLIVCEQRGGSWVQIADDDDGGNGLNSRVMLSGTGARAYLLVAAATSGAGPFDLSVRDRPPPPPPSPARPIAAGETKTGRIGGGTGADHLLQAQAGTLYLIDLTSQDFDAVVEVRRAADAASAPALASDDDSGGDRNARLLFVPPTSGAYRITATSFGGGEGAFELAVVEARPTLLRPGEHALRLTGGPALFRFEAAANTAYLIEMKSSAFDPVVDVRAASGAGPVETDDDGGEGNNARLMFVPRAPGPYLITARALGSGQGAYTLSLTPFRRQGD